MSHKGSFSWVPVAAIGVAVALVAVGAMTVMLSRDRGSGRPLTLSDTDARAPAAPSPEPANASPAAPGAAGGGTAAASTGAGVSSPAPTVAAGHRVATPPSTQSPVVGKQSPTPTSPTGPTGGTGPIGPRAAAPGTYRYHQAGSLPGTPAEGTLVVAPASASGTQEWTRKVGGTMPAATTVMLFNTIGSYLVSPGGQVGGVRATCTFGTPVPWPPWPTMPGATFASQATCSGPVSTYQVSGQVQGTTTLSLDGHAVATTIVVNTFALKGTYAGSPLTMTLTETDYYAPSLRVPVMTRTHVVGSAIGLPLSTDRTDTLESATPS
jgi:hypothetical protein